MTAKSAKTLRIANPISEANNSETELVLYNKENGNKTETTTNTKLAI